MAEETRDVNIDEVLRTSVSKELLREEWLEVTERLSKLRVKIRLTRATLGYRERDIEALLSEGFIAEVRADDLLRWKRGELSEVMSDLISGILAAEIPLIADVTPLLELKPEGCVADISPYITAIAVSATRENLSEVLNISEQGSVPVILRIDSRTSLSWISILSTERRNSARYLELSLSTLGLALSLEILTYNPEMMVIVEGVRDSRELEPFLRYENVIAFDLTEMFMRDSEAFYSLLRKVR